jgi:NurA-like 5'-3' nuclease
MMAPKGILLRLSRDRNLVIAIHGLILVDDALDQIIIQSGLVPQDDRYGYISFGYRYSNMYVKKLMPANNA